MQEKTFRPKSGVENLTLSYPLGSKRVTRSGSDWPLTTSDPVEVEYLSGVDALTDRPAPQPKAQPKKQSAKTERNTEQNTEQEGSDA